MALLDAYITGLEVIYRLGEAVNMGHYKLGWHPTSTLDSIGATAAACRLQRLNAVQCATALSLTTSMGAGYGFSMSNFARIYARVFGISPTADRSAKQA